MTKYYILYQLGCFLIIGNVTYQAIIVYTKHASYIMIMAVDIPTYPIVTFPRLPYLVPNDPNQL